MPKQLARILRRGLDASERRILACHVLRKNWQVLSGIEFGPYIAKRPLFGSVEVLCDYEPAVHYAHNKKLKIWSRRTTSLCEAGLYIGPDELDREYGDDLFEYTLLMRHLAADEVRRSVALIRNLGTLAGSSAGS